MTLGLELGEVGIGLSWLGEGLDAGDKSIEVGGVELERGADVEFVSRLELLSNILGIVLFTGVVEGLK